MTDIITEYRGRAKRYEFIDGTGEMLFGLLWLAVPLSQLLAGTFELPRRWGSTAAFIACVWLLIAAGNAARKVIKRRLTYPRTGFVSSRRDPGKTLFGVLLALTISAVLGLVLALAGRYSIERGAVEPWRLFMLLIGVATYLFFVIAASREHRWKLLVAASMAVCSVFCAFSGWEKPRFEMVTAFLFAGFWIASGVATLLLYLARTRPAGAAQ